MDFFPTYQSLLAGCGAEGGNPAEVTVPMPIFRYLISRALASIDFDEAAYLSANPDVKLAVEEGRFESGRDHFVACGFSENRSVGLQSVDIAWYLDVYPDVKGAIETGKFESAAHHFSVLGRKEGRACSERYHTQQQMWVNIAERLAATKSTSSEPSFWAFESLKSEISHLSRAMTTGLAANRQNRVDDRSHVAELLNNTQNENIALRERMNDLMHDVTIAWVRYSDLLKSVDRHYASDRSNGVASLRDAIKDGMLEAKRQRAEVLKKKSVSVVTNSLDSTTQESIRGENLREPSTEEDAAIEFCRLVVGDPTIPPGLTLICASDETTARFETFISFITSVVMPKTIEVFAPLADCSATANGSPVDTGEGGLAARVNRLILHHARGVTVALVSAPGVLSDGWMSGFEAVLGQNALAAAVSGIILADPRMSAWSGACLGPDQRLRLEDVQLPIEDYRLVSAARIDHVVPGFVAFALDILRELDGFGDSRSLAEALLDFSNKAAEAGFELYRAPHARLTLSREWRGREQLLTRHFDKVAFPNSRPKHRRRPRVLVVDHLTPKPDQDAGSVDIFWGLRILQSFGYEVTFLPMYDTAHAGRYTESLREMGVYCPVAPQLTTPRDFIEAHGGNFDMIILYRVIVAYLLIDACRAYAPQAKIIFHTVDLHFLREERYADMLNTPEARAQSQYTKIEELRCLNAADVNILVSRHEYQLVESLAPNAKKELVRVMHPVPGRLAPRRDRQGVLFVGGFTHAPNFDAVVYLLDEIWDLVRKQDPKQTLRIVGANAPDDILNRHDPARGIEILGFVQDLRPLYAEAMVNVAPLRFGAGIKGKVIAAMGVGLPVVATSVATEGMDLLHEWDVLLGNSPCEIANAICRLCQDEVLWDRVSNNALEVAQAEFSVDAQVPRWRRMLSSLAMPT